MYTKRKYSSVTFKFQSCKLNLNLVTIYDDLVLLRSIICKKIFIIILGYAINFASTLLCSYPPKTNHTVQLPSPSLQLPSFTKEFQMHFPRNPKHCYWFSHYQQIKDCNMKEHWRRQPSQISATCWNWQQNFWGKSSQGEPK